MLDDEIRHGHPANHGEHNGTDDEALIDAALIVLRERITRPGSRIPMQGKDVNDYLLLRLHQLDHEVFGVMYLDKDSHLIADEILFRGTVGSTTVFPREVVKEALRHDADTVLLYHNHPGGSLKISEADIQTTSKVQDALKIVGVTIRDHLIVAHNQVVSFVAEGVPLEIKRGRAPTLLTQS